MQKQNILHKNYTIYQEFYQSKLPINIDCIIPDNDSVRLLSQFVKEMDLRDLYSTDLLPNQGKASNTTSDAKDCTLLLHGP